MDDHTLRVLDFPRIRELLAGQSQTELGRQALLELQPGLARAAVEREFALTEELLKTGDDPPLCLVADILLLLDPAARLEAVLSPQELLSVRKTLDGLGKVHDYLAKRRDWMPLLAAEGADIRSFAPLEREIDRIVGPDCDIKDDASPELSRIRIRLRRLRNQIVKALESTVSANPDLFQNQSVSLRSGRYVLPLRAEARNRFDAVLHDTSDSGHTLFVEPLSMLAEQNELARLHSAEQDEVQRILRAVTGSIQAEAEGLTAALRGVARLDLLCAKKRFAVQFDAARPVISTRNTVQLINARHPLLHLKKGSVVPLNFVLPDNARVVLISGPNAGGKTVAMKTVGLFALLLASGLFLPASAGTELPLFRKVFADIGDEQSLEEDLSSFSAHLKRTGQILQQVDDSSLVLLDEIGGSTSPEEGSALAIAVLERLNERGTMAVATSHLGPLKAFVQDTEGMANAAMEYKTRPTYRLLMGVPGESSALEMSRSLGFPSDVLERARTFLNQDWLRVNERMQELTARLEQNMRLNLELEHERAQAKALRLDLEQKSAGFREYEKTERRRLQTEREAILRETRREIENLVRQIKETQASHEAIKAAKTYVEAQVPNPTPGPQHPTPSTRHPAPSPRHPAPSPQHQAPSTQPLAPGSFVYSRTFARQGTVTELDNEQATVAFGNIKIRLQTSDLQVLDHAEPEPQPISPEETEEFDPRLNVRGMTQEEARAQLVRFLDRAEMHSARHISILHGKGTGVLRKMLWTALKHDRRIAEVRAGEPREGGDGITFATLKK